MSVVDVVIVAGCFVATIVGLCVAIVRARRQPDPPYYPFDGGNL